ncbi:MAG: cardiolipin synthase [Muribaculaceae bacterium]|nr:cardiolipin synthase [Muribaculaceae bacterium]
MLLGELFPYANVVYDVLTYLYFLTIVTTIAVVVSENRNPVKSLAWVTVLILLPVVGLVLYFIFGRSLKGVRMISRSQRRRLRGQGTFQPINFDALPLSPESRQHIKLTHNLAQAHYFPGNDIQIFTSGIEKFNALKADLLAANTYIHLQYYIIEDDRIGRELAQILEEKARQGVKVRVMYDHVGSYHFKASYFKRLRKAGIEAHPFLKVTFTQLVNRLNWRNHRKVVVIDGAIGYIGGMNVADRYVYGSRKHRPWRDTHLRITGDAVAALEYSFAVDWNFSNRNLLTETALHHEHVKPGDPTGVQIIPAGPTGQWSNIALVLLHAIAEAKKCIWIQTPYFLPNDALLKAMQTAALAGVDVRVMLPRTPDSRLLRLASCSYLKECLLAGIKIYFYEPAMLHSKVVIIDDDFATTGSTNFDFRSFEHNFECNALIYGAEFNRLMKEIFLNDQRQSTRIILSHWRRRPVTTKALESLARLLSPIL